MNFAQSSVNVDDSGASRYGLSAIRMLFCKISEHILDEILIFGKVQIIVSTDYFTKPIVKLHATLTLEFSVTHYRWVTVLAAVADILSSFKSGFRPK